MGLPWQPNGHQHRTGGIRAGTVWDPREGKGEVEVGLWGTLMTSACEAMGHPKPLNLWKHKFQLDSPKNKCPHL